MSSSNNEQPSDTLFQLWKRYAVKISNLILNHRITWPLNNSNGDKNQLKHTPWFNFHVDEVEEVTKKLEKCLKSTVKNPSSLYIYIDVYVKIDQNSTKNVLLERWLLNYVNGDNSDNEQSTNTAPSPRNAAISATDTENELSCAYRKCLVLIRSLYTYLLLLPSYKLFLKNKVNRRNSSRVHYNIMASLSRDETRVFEENSTANVHFSPIDIPSLKASIKISVTYRKKTVTLDELIFSVTSKNVLTESNIIENHFVHTGQQNPPDEHHIRARSESMPVEKMGDLARALEEKKNVQKQKPPLYRKLSDTEDNTEQSQHHNAQLLQQQQQQHISYATSAPTNISHQMWKTPSPPSSTQQQMGYQNGIPIKMKRQNSQQNLVFDETPPFSRQYSFGSYNNGPDSQDASKIMFDQVPGTRSRANSIGSNTYSSSASPPFGNHLLSSSWKKKNFRLSISPFNDSPLNSYQPSAGSLLSSSLKQQQHQLHPDNLPGSLDNRTPFDFFPGAFLLDSEPHHLGSSDSSSSSSSNKRDSRGGIHNQFNIANRGIGGTDDDLFANSFFDFTPHFLDKSGSDSYNVHTYSYNHPYSNYSSYGGQSFDKGLNIDSRGDGDLMSQDDNLIFADEEHGNAPFPYLNEGGLAFVDYSKEKKDKAKHRAENHNETRDLDNDEDEIDSLLHRINQAPLRLNSFNKTEMLQNRDLNRKVADVIDHIHRLKLLRQQQHNSGGVQQQ